MTVALFSPFVANFVFIFSHTQYFDLQATVMGQILRFQKTLSETIGMIMALVER